MDRKIEPFGCNDEMMLRFIGEIIRQAIIDYMIELPDESQLTKKSQRERAAKLKFYKGSAEAFFRSSRLFKLSGVSFEYLKKAYERGEIVKGYDDYGEE